MVDSKARILQSRLDDNVIEVVATHLRLSSIRERTKLNQECVMTQLRECLRLSSTLQKHDSSALFVYACTEIHNKYGWA